MCTDGGNGVGAAPFLLSFFLFEFHGRGRCLTGFCNVVFNRNDEGVRDDVGLWLLELMAPRATGFVRKGVNRRNVNS